jgi:outer membrane protein assembly factor BamE (lipoprotein component of BamABCDE complex)
MKRFSKLMRSIDLLLFAVLSIYGCSSSPELVSEISVEEKVARLSLGRSDKNEVEGIFGTEHGNDRNRWLYVFSDRQFEIAERRQGPGLGVLPVAAGTVPINTRALVTVVFNEAGVIKRLEFARFFEEPFINDYWYLLKGGTKDPLDSLAAIGETVGFKATGLDKDAGTFTFEDPSSKARVAVKLDGELLKITSRNPYNRLANEYRAYTKRESALTNSVSESDIVQ